MFNGILPHVQWETKHTVVRASAILFHVEIVIPLAHYLLKKLCIDSPAKIRGRETNLFLDFLLSNTKV